MMEFLKPLMHSKLNSKLKMNEAMYAMMIFFGILIIIFPKLIAWMIGLYLIITGLLGLIEISKS